ncbi:MAG: DUF72 domain-containing protein [Chthoniobacterales bacterium]|nr:DUF72 domain-containing protein [Chthoniobacterales bacterium]
MAQETRIGLAGWSEAAGRYRALLSQGPNEVTGLRRYATAFDFVEINSSFYRKVRASTCEKWASEVPDDFLFSVKMHRLITHYTRLQNTDLLGDFFGPLSGLGAKLAVVLVQLPPTLTFDSRTAGHFFAALRRIYKGHAVCEPRHASWQSAEAGKTLAEYRIGPVLTAIPDGRTRLGDKALPVYVRLHGEPRRYYSSYDTDQLRQLTAFLKRQSRRPRFVVFDNTASSAGVRNALELQGLLERRTKA